MSQKLTKEQRSVIFNRLIEEAGVPSWGRARRISEDCKVSPATAAGWLSGSLPRDCVSLLNCSEIYDIDVYEWVEGVKKGKAINPSKLQSGIARIRQHEIDHQVTFDADRFASLTAMLYEDEEKGEFLLNNAGLLSGEKTNDTL